MSKTRPLVGAGVAAAVALAAAPVAEAARVERFTAVARPGEIHYRVVLCAPIGAHIEFRARLTAHRKTVVLPPRTGSQEHACPAWRWTESKGVRAGRYRTDVVIRVDDERVRTKRVTVVVPAGRRG